MLVGRPDRRIFRRAFANYLIYQSLAVLAIPHSSPILGFSVNLFLGYYVTTRRGFTFNLQRGLEVGPGLWPRPRSNGETLAASNPRKGCGREWIGVPYIRAVFRASFAARRRASPIPVAKSLGRAALARAFDFMNSSLTWATEIEPGPRRMSLPFAGRSQGPCVARVSYPYRIRPCPPCNYVSEQQTRLAGPSCLLLSYSAERLTPRHRHSRAVLIQLSMPCADRRDLAPSYAGTARATWCLTSRLCYTTR